MRILPASFIALTQPNRTMTDLLGTLTSTLGGGTTNQLASALGASPQQTQQGIMAALPNRQQTFLLSATMPKQMEELSRSYLTNPRKVQVATPGKTANKIDQSVIFIEKVEKPSKLREVLSADPDALSLVFSRTKHGAERMKKKLVADGYNAVSIHGDKTQGQRDKALIGRA